MSEEMNTTRPTGRVCNVGLIEAKYIIKARQEYTSSNNDIEIDDNPKVSISNGGAWVAAWLWVAEEEVEIG